MMETNLANPNEETGEGLEEGLVTEVGNSG